MVVESRADYPSEYEAIRSVAARLGVTSPESLRKWVRQAEVDGGGRPGRTTDELTEIKALKKENAELRRANEILKSILLAAAGQEHRVRDDSVEHGETGAELTVTRPGDPLPRLSA